MGLLLSTVLDNLYMEDLESSWILDIIPSSIKWLWYMNDILAILFIGLNGHNILGSDNLELTIKFTSGEKNNQLPFLGTITYTQLRVDFFDVYHKPTLKKKKMSLYSYPHHDVKKVG